MGRNEFSDLILSVTPLHRSSESTKPHPSLWDIKMRMDAQDQTLLCQSSVMCDNVLQQHRASWLALVAASLKLHR